MKPLILNFLLLPVLLLATQAQRGDVKARVVSEENNLTTMKFMIRHPMIGEECYNNQKQLEKNYITHITARNEEKVVLDVSTSFYLKSDPIIQHSFKTLDQKKLSYIITDNKDQNKEYLLNTKKRRSRISSSTKMPSFKKELSVDYRKINPKAWEATTIQEAVTALYGEIKAPIKGKIAISGPESTYCHESIPVHISSKVDLESLVVFNDKNIYPTVAIFSIQKEDIVDFSFRIKMFTTCTDYTVVVVAKDRDGRFYKSSTKGRMACADGCGGGG